MLRRVLTRGLSFKLPGTIVSTDHHEVAPLHHYDRPDEVYKPAAPIEFDSRGETLIYSADPMKNVSVFFPLPWSMGTLALPGMAYLWLNGALGPYSWVLPLAGYLATLPHAWYLYNLRFHVDKIWYVRGGWWKFQNSGVHQVTTYAYTEPANVHLMSVKRNLEHHRGKFAVFLGDEGQLSRNLVLQTEVWTEFYDTRTNQNLTVHKSGTVHNPELFQALAQGYKIDESNFVTNVDPENSPVSRSKSFSEKPIPIRMRSIRDFIFLGS